MLLTRKRLRRQDHGNRYPGNIPGLVLVDAAERMFAVARWLFCIRLTLEGTASRRIA